MIVDMGTTSGKTGVSATKGTVKKQRTTAAENVLECLRALHEDESTSALREAALAIVALRRLYVHEELPDWTGRSIEYRDAIERLYRQAEVPPDSESSIQAKVRYHVGNVLREVAPAEELQQLGLAVSGPKGRAADLRAAGGARRRRPAEVQRTRVDNPLMVAALGLDAVRMLQVMDIQGEDRDIVDGIVRKMLDECITYLKA